jgi:hypothetical protein
LVKIVFFASAAIAFGLVFVEVPGATPKKPDSGFDCAQPTIRVGANPSDVVANRPNLSTLFLEVGRRD